MLYLAMGIFAFGLGLGSGPQAAWYSEILPASVRFSGVSISYAMGAVIGGAFAPTIAQALINATGSSAYVSLYLLGVRQEVGATVFDKRRAPAIMHGPLNPELLRHVRVSGVEWDRSARGESTAASGLSPTIPL